MQPALIEDRYTCYQNAIFQWVMTHKNTRSQLKEGINPQNLWKILKDFFFLSNCTMVPKVKWMGGKDMFDAFITMSICAVLVGSGMQCSGSLWSQLWSMHGFCTSACIMELAGMELAYTLQLNSALLLFWL